jgi:hypothetical protein
VDLPILSNEFARLNCSLDDQPYIPCGIGLKGRFVARNLAEGPHELIVKAVDEAGNQADPISLKWNSGKFCYIRDIKMDVYDRPLTATNGKL